MSKDKKSRTKRRLPFLIAFIFFFAVMAVSGYKAISILTEYKSGTDTYRELEQYVTIESTPSPETEIETEIETGHSADTPAEPEAAEKPKSSTVWPKVDFEALSRINPDVVGWIYIEGTSINYPILLGEDNDYYLTHMIDGEYNSSGSIFMDFRNDGSFDEIHTVLYGHHMNNGSMFSDLLNYKKQAYFDEHPTALIMTPEKNYTLHLFTGYVAHISDDAWKTDFASEEEYANWLIRIGESSLFSSDITPSQTDRVVTLSTCSYEFDDARFVAVGVLEPEE